MPNYPSPIPVTTLPDFDDEFGTSIERQFGAVFFNARTDEWGRPRYWLSDTDLEEWLADERGDWNTEIDIGREFSELEESLDYFNDRLAVVGLQVLGVHSNGLSCVGTLVLLSRGRPSSGSIVSP